MASRETSPLKTVVDQIVVVVVVVVEDQNNKTFIDLSMSDVNSTVLDSKYTCIEAGTRERPKTKHDATHNGRHDMCPLMDAGLESFGFENVCFDEMHRAANAMKCFIAYMKGDRAVSDLDRKFSAATKKIPSIKYKNRLAEFQLLTREERMVDAVTNNTLISPLYMIDNGAGNKLLNLFSSLGLGRLTHALNRRYFAAMTGDILSTLDTARSVMKTARIVDAKSDFLPFYDGGALYNRGVESCWSLVTNQNNNNGIEALVIMEGMFPESERVYIFHEIIDILSN